MSNEITSEQIRAMADELDGPMGFPRHADMLRALAAEREQSPAVGHAAMVARLRELCLTLRQEDRDMRWCASAIEDILSAIQPSRTLGLL